MKYGGKRRKREGRRDLTKTNGDIGEECKNRNINDRVKQSEACEGYNVTRTNANRDRQEGVIQGEGGIQDDPADSLAEMGSEFVEKIKKQTG